MKNKVKNILRPFYRLIRLLFELNLIKTFYINFKKLPLKHAIKLPIYVYKGVKLETLKGEIIINHIITPGLIRIGYDLDGSIYSGLKTRIIIRGKLVFLGNAIISKGAIINVSGLLNIGCCSNIGSGAFIKSMTNITIGNNSRVTYGCTIFDSNIHYVKNIETGVIKNNKSPISIGNNCWINPGTIIAKGTQLPNYSITARNSYLDKNYHEYGENLFLVGSPAKVSSAKLQRIISYKEQKRLDKLFYDTGYNEIATSKGLFDEKDHIVMHYKYI